MTDDLNGSRSAQRAVDILMALADGPDTMGVSVIAQALGISKGTVHRLLQTLVGKGLVSYVPATQTYRLGGGALRLGLRVLDRLPLRREADPTLRQLRDLTGETAALFVAVGERAVALEQAVTHQEPRRMLRLGSTIALHSGATGRVLLAHHSRSFRQRYLQKAIAAPNTHPRIDDVEALVGEMEAIRTRGYGLEIMSESRPTNALAFPLLNGSGALLGSITIVGPPGRWTDEIIRTQIADCQRLVDDLNLRLKYMEPDTAVE
jgi:DNA-binding IclR family transcriptional regulator